MPCWLRKQRLRKFNSKDFMSDESKIENEIINFSVYRGEQAYANEMKRKQRNLGTESCLAASVESGNWGGIVVCSISSTDGSCKRKLFNVTKYKVNSYEASIPICT